MVPQGNISTSRKTREGTTLARAFLVWSLYQEVVTVRATECSAKAHELNQLKNCKTRGRTGCLPGLRLGQ